MRFRKFRYFQIDLSGSTLFVFTTVLQLLQPFLFLMYPALSNLVLSLPTHIAMHPGRLHRAKLLVAR
jgi:hypothetical protein